MAMEDGGRMIKRIPDGMKSWPVVGPYSPALEVSPGRFLFAGIIVDLDADKQPVASDRNEQILHVLLKCLRALESCGLHVCDLVRFQVKLAGSMDGYAYLNELMATHYASDLPFPVRDVIAPAALPANVHIEIVMEAIRQEE